MSFGFAVTWHKYLIEKLKFLKIKKLINQGKHDHDDTIYKKGFMRKMPDEEFLFTNNKTFKKVCIQA